MILPWLLTIALDDAWIVVPNKPNTYEESTTIKITVGSFYNPTGTAIHPQTQNATFLLQNWIRGFDPGEDYEGYPEIPWTSTYNPLAEWSLTWTDLGSSYTVQAGKHLHAYYNVTRSVGAKTFHWWLDEDLVVTRYREVFSNVNGRHSDVTDLAGNPGEPGSD